MREQLRVHGPLRSHFGYQRSFPLHHFATLQSTASRRVGDRVVLYFTLAVALRDMTHLQRFAGTPYKIDSLIGHPRLIVFIFRLRHFSK